MANRATPLTQIETLSGNISAATYFDNNISPAITALNDASLGYVNYIGTDTGSANNYIVAPGFGIPSALNAGMQISFNPANSNTGASTLTVSPLASGAIKGPGGAALIGGEIVAGTMTTVIFDGTSYRIAALPWIPATFALGTITTSQTVDCKNASSVSISFGSNTTTALNITMNNLAVGVPVFINCVGNTSGGTSTVFPIGKSVSGVSYTTDIVQQGISGLQTGLQISAAKAVFCSGTAMNGFLYMTAVQTL